MNKNPIFFCKFYVSMRIPEYLMEKFIHFEKKIPNS